MTIKSAQQSDIPQIANLVKSLVHNFLDNQEAELPDWLSETLTYDAFLKRVTDPEYLHFIMEEEKSVIGYIAIQQSGYVYHLFIAEEFQGNGIARKLWEHAKQHVSSSVFTLRSSMFAVPIYQKFGFSKSAPIGNKEGISFQPMELKTKVGKSPH